jgi:hypothetical protein
MTNLPRRWRRPLDFAAFLAAAALIAGCFNPFSPRVAPTTGFAQQPPTPDSPVNVLRLYEWCWNRRDPQLYREILTEDFRFAFAQADTAGNIYRDRTLTRDEELEIAENIFVRGTASEPPPVSISLTFDPNLLAVPDDRPGKTAKWHRMIRAGTLLRIEQPDIEVRGTTKFYVVRGDSADIPTELEARFPRDSTRWWIERIEDETLGDESAPARVSSTRRGGAAPATAAVDPLRVTWGQLRAFFHDRAR